MYTPYILYFFTLSGWNLEYKWGATVRTHTRTMGEIVPGVPPKGAKTCFVFFLFSMQRGLLATYPAPILTIFLKKDVNRFPHVYTSNFWISAQRVFHVPKTAKVSTVEGGVLVHGVQPKRHNFRRRESFRGPTWSNLYEKISNMEQSNCLNCVLMDWKRWSKKNLQHKYCADNARSTTTQYIEQQYLCCQFFLISAFSPSRLQFLLRNIK